jgi:hypothetical protein
VSTTRGPCPKCHSSDGFITFANESRHCFVCDYHEHPEMTIESLKSSLTPTKNKRTGDLELPKDFDYYLPKIALDWISQYGLTGTELRRNKIGWSDTCESIIFPVFDETGCLKMYQQRYFGASDKQPKYITVGNKGDLIHLPDPVKHDTIVVVEDMVSAIKVSRVTNCMPLLGNTLSIPVAMKLRLRFKRARVWLDANMMQKSVRTSLTLSVLGLPTTTIFTDKDPKEYAVSDIRGFVDVFGKE